MQGVPSITANIVRAVGSVDLAIEALRADDSEEAQDFIEKYDGLSKSDQKLLKLEEIFTAAGLSARRFVEVVTGALMQQCGDVTKMMVAVSQPKVVEATIFAATDRKPIFNPVTGELMTYTNGDVKAMELFHKATGFLPTPKGANTTINLNQLNQTAQLNAGEDEDDEPVELQSMDAYLLELQDVLRPQLPAPTAPSSVIPVNAPQLDYIDAEV